MHRLSDGETGDRSAFFAALAPALWLVDVRGVCFDLMATRWRHGRSELTTKEDLHDLVDVLSEPNAEEALSYLRWLTSDRGTLFDEEFQAVRRGEAEIARGDYVTLADLRGALGG